MRLTKEQRAELKTLALRPEEARGTLETFFGCDRESTLSKAVLVLLADLEEVEDAICNGRELLREEVQRSFERGKEVLKLESDLASIYEAYADQQRLVRELDVILCGKDGAASQASLCDLVGYVQHQLSGLTLSDLAATQKQLTHWKSNHEAVVKKLRLFTQRDDLPVDRLPAYQHVLDLEKQLAEANDSLALDSAIAEAVEPYKRDAERWRNLKPYYTAAVFDPEREDGLDLGKGVALVFMLPEGSRVSANADSTIDALSAKEAP